MTLKKDIRTLKGNEKVVEMIVDENCKHNWIKKVYKSPITKKKFASWENCTKCGSEKSRKVYGYR